MTVTTRCRRCRRDFDADRWKRAERQIAAALGGGRLPSNGRGQPDVRAGGWAVQVKTVKALPAWLVAAVDQAARDAGPGEAPVVVLIEVRQGCKARRLAVLDLGDWWAVAGPDAAG